MAEYSVSNVVKGTEFGGILYHSALSSIGSCASNWTFCCPNFKAFADAMRDEESRAIGISLVTRMANHYVTGPTITDDDKIAYVIGELIMAPMDEGVCTPAVRASDVFYDRLKMEDYPFHTATLSQYPDKDDRMKRVKTIPGLFEIIGLEIKQLGASEIKKYQNRALKYLVAMIISLTKRGQITTGKLSSSIGKINKSLGISLSVTETLVTTIWKRYGSFYQGSNRRIMVPKWLDTWKDRILRLNLFGEQTRFSGMTTYILIHQAIQSVRDFPWIKLNKLIPRDFKNFEKAIKVVGDDSFKGFDEKATELYIANFVSLGYCSRILLIKSGHNTLTDYKGLEGKNVPNKILIDTLIDKWEDLRKAQDITISEEEVAEFNVKMEKYTAH